MCKKCLESLKSKNLLVVAFVLDRESGSESKIASDLLRIYAENAQNVKVLTSSLTPDTELTKFRDEFFGKIEFNVHDFPKFFLRHGRAVFLIGIKLWHRKALKNKSEQILYAGLDLGIHLSYATFFYGTPLSKLQIPYIFGPAGFSKFSRNSIRVNGMWSLLEILRNFLVDSILRFDPFVRKSFAKASIIIPTDTTIKQNLQDILNISNLTDPIPHISVTISEGNESKKLLRLIWVGHFIKKKDPFLALEIFEKVANNFDNLTLQFCGTGPLENKLRNAIAASPYKSRIFVSGWLTSKKVHHEISKSEILIHTSSRETAGNQILESIMLGTKVITSCRSNLFTWLSTPAISYVEIEALISRKELVSRYACEILDWFSIEPLIRLKLIDSSQDLLKDFNPNRIVENTLHEYFSLN